MHTANAAQLRFSFCQQRQLSKALPGSMHVLLGLILSYLSVLRLFGYPEQLSSSQLLNNWAATNVGSVAPCLYQHFVAPACVCCWGSAS